MSQTTLNKPSENTAPSKKSLFAFRLILALFLILIIGGIIVVAAEIGMRWSGKYPISGFSLDDDVIWRTRSGICENKRNDEGGSFELRTNKNGFRGIEWEKKKDRKRILVLGDSYTAGYDFPDDQIFTGILQAKLDSERSTSNQYEVINISSPAWSLDQQMLMYERYAQELQPDYTILMASPNDIREAYCKKFVTANSTGGVVIHPPAFIMKKRLGWFLSGHSSAFQYLQTKTFNSNYGDFSDLFEVYTMNFGVADSGDWDRPLYLKKSLPDVDEAFNLYQLLFERLRSDCEKQNCVLLCTLNPVQDYIQGDYAADTLLDQNKVLAFFEALCENKNVPFANLYEPASKISNPASLYQTHDSHYSSFGNLFTGKELFNFFAENRNPN